MITGAAPSTPPAEPADPGAGQPVLTVRDLTVTFGSRRHRALCEVSLTVNRGQVMALVGESGCGKSLTALAVMGLLPRGATVAGGHIDVGGHPILGVGERRLRRLRGSTMAMVFQDPMLALNPLQPIGRQIAEPLVLHTGLSRREREERVLELLRAVGVPDPRARAGHLPHEFSGGLRQRIMIAIALACRPHLLIADEPTTALDVTIQAQVLDLLRELTGARHTAVLFITHDMGVVAQMADHVTVMYAGHVVESAPVGPLFGTPEHPYTAALLDSVPRLDMRTDVELPTIPGRVPAPGQAPAGCPFRDRCPRQTDRCARRPPLAAAGTARHVACWHPHHAEESP